MSSPSASPESPRPFTGDMTVQEAMAHHPVARWVLFSYNLAGCNSCASSESETLAKLSVTYGIPLEMLLDDLNGLLDPA